MKRQCNILASSLVVTLTISFIGFNILCGIIGISFYIWFIFSSLQAGQTQENKEHDEEEGIE